MCHGGDRGGDDAGRLCRKRAPGVPMRSISHAILLSPLFPQTAKRSIVPPWGLSCWLRVALKPTTRARLVGMRVDGLLTGRAWLRRAAWSVERLASEPGGLVPTTVT